MIKVVVLPDKPTVVGLIDVDKGNLMDILQEKYLKSIPFWDGTCSKAGLSQLVYRTKIVCFPAGRALWLVRTLHGRDGDA